MLGPMLVSIHNLTFYQRLMAEAQRAIADGRLATFVADRRDAWQVAPNDEFGMTNDK
jgi:queuine tRNA-ribosyltransferase